MGLKRFSGAVLVMGLAAAALPAGAAAPNGVFLWYPDQARAPSSADCDALVQRVRPSRDKADAWLWGRAPFDSEPEYYLFLGRDRIETTYAAEGDYDTGTIRLDETRGDETAFDLVPDDHPTITIKGSIVAPVGSSVVKIILRNIPSNGTSERVTYFCRFADDTQA